MKNKSLSMSIYESLNESKDNSQEILDKIHSYINDAEKKLKTDPKKAMNLAKRAKKLAEANKKVLEKKESSLYGNINGFISNIEKNYLKESIEDVLKKDDEFRYQLLGRLKSDCDYYLGNGNRNDKHLWAGNVKDQIQTMKDLYNSFSDDMKPDWISLEDIDNYEKEMTNGLNESFDYEGLVIIDDLGNTESVKSREAKEDSDFKNSGAAMISSNDPSSLKNSHNIAVRAQNCIYKLEDIKSELDKMSSNTNYDSNIIFSVLNDYGFKADITDKFKQNLGDLSDAVSCQNFISILIHLLQQIKEKDLNEDVNYLTPTTKDEPLNIKPIDDEINDVQELVGKYTKIGNGYHEIISVEPDGDKYIVSFGVGTDKKEGGEYYPASFDELKNLQLYVESDDIDESVEDEITAGNIKQKAQEVLPAEDIETHDGDLYLKVSDKSTELVNKMKDKDSGLLKKFKSEKDGQMWYDIPFANMEDDYKDKVNEEATVFVNDTAKEPDFQITDVTVLEPVADGDVLPPDMQTLLVMADQELTESEGADWGHINILSSRAAKDGTKSNALFELRTPTKTRLMSFVLEGEGALKEFSVYNSMGQRKFVKKTTTPVAVMKEFINQFVAEDRLDESDKSMKEVKPDKKAIKKVIEEFLSHSMTNNLLPSMYETIKANIETYNKNKENSKTGDRLGPTMYKKIREKINGFVSQLPTCAMAGNHDNYKVKDGILIYGEESDGLNLKDYDSIIDALFGSEWLDSEVKSNKEIDNAKEKTLEKVNESVGDYKYVIGLSKESVQDVANGDVDFDMYVMNVYTDKEDLVDDSKVGLQLTPLKKSAKVYDDKADANYDAGLIKDNDTEWKTVAVVPLGSVNESAEDFEIKGLNGNAKDVTNEFKNVEAYLGNLSPIKIFKIDKDYVVYKNTAKDYSDWVYSSDSKDNIEGWLYGAVQAKNRIIESEEIEEAEKLEYKVFKRTALDGKDWWIVASTNALEREKETGKLQQEGKYKTKKEAVARKEQLEKQQKSMNESVVPSPYRNITIGDIVATYNVNTGEIVYSIPAKNINDKKKNINDIEKTDIPYDTETIIRNYIEKNVAQAPDVEGSEEVKTDVKPNGSEDIEVKDTEKVDEADEEPDVENPAPNGNGDEEAITDETQSETGSAFFFLKPKSVEFIQDAMRKGVSQGKSTYVVVKTVNLPKDQFDEYCSDLQGHYSFLEDINISDTDTKNFSFNVVKVTCNDADYSVLADPVGYDYSRYAAVI